MKHKWHTNFSHYQKFFIHLIWKIHVSVASLSWNLNNCVLACTKENLLVITGTNEVKRWCMQSLQEKFLWSHRLNTEYLKTWTVTNENILIHTGTNKVQTTHNFFSKSEKLYIFTMGNSRFTDPSILNFELIVTGADAKENLWLLTVKNEIQTT